MRQMKPFGRSEPPVIAGRSAPKQEAGRIEPPLQARRAPEPAIPRLGGAARGQAPLSRSAREPAMKRFDDDPFETLSRVGARLSTLRQQGPEPSPPAAAATTPEPRTPAQAGAAPVAVPAGVAAALSAAEPPPAPAAMARAPRPGPVAAPRRAASRRTAGKPRDPAPSRLSYRMHRLWLTPVYRAFFRVGVPAFALAFGAGLYLSDEGRRAALAGQANAAIRSVQERPEFMVNLMSVEGASPELGEAIRVVLPVDFPVSSFDLDLLAMREAVAGLDAVASADVRVRPGGVLEVRVEERVPAALWRTEDGLVAVDATGHPVKRIADRRERPDLPVISGEGADRAVAEALALIEAAAPVAPRLRGLVRMGARRWDVVLDEGQRILLPERDPVPALERVMALALAEDMLARDVSVVDMRHGERPTLRLSPNALNEMRRVQEIETGASNG